MNYAYFSPTFALLWGESLRLYISGDADCYSNSVEITRIWIINGFEHGKLELILQRQQELFAMLLELQ